MRYIWQHIEAILKGYGNEAPLTYFLKNYFRSFPKLGSRDRKILSEMAYCWYRCSNAIVTDLPPAEKIKACLLLCETSVPQIVQLLPEGWKGKLHLGIDEKIAFLAAEGIAVNTGLLGAGITPFISGLPVADYIHSFFYQPGLFIRVLKAQEQQVNKLLTAASISWQSQSIHPAFLSYSFANGTAIDKVLPADMYVVQDLSSQKTGTYFHPLPKEKWWDCCSGAGGKSLLLKTIEPGVQLTVSDKRDTILHNLQKRFHQYHLKQPQMIVADVADAGLLQQQLPGAQFGQIICDVPCTGSGTWARTPEQLYFFNPQLIADYAARQQKIAINASKYLQKGGTIYYITCSVFEAENEAVVSYLLANTSLQLKEKALINGIADRADSMFIAVLVKE